MYGGYINTIVSHTHTLIFTHHTYMNSGTHSPTCAHNDCNEVDQPNVWMEKIIVRTTS